MCDTTSFVIGSFPDSIKSDSSFAFIPKLQSLIMSEIKQVKVASEVTIDSISKPTFDASGKLNFPQPYLEYEVNFDQGENHFSVLFNKPMPSTLRLVMMVINDEKNTSVTMNHTVWEGGLCPKRRVCL